MTLNNSLELLQPIMDGMGAIMSRLELLVGGVFGLYILFFLYRIYTITRSRKTINQINERLATIEKKLKIRKKKK